MALSYGAFDFDQLAYAEQPNVARATGRKTVSMTYAGGRTVVFQLGDPKAALRAPFGVDVYTNAAQETKSIKVELTPPTHEFIKRFETSTKAAAAAHAEEWFKKPHPPEQIAAMFSSRVREQDGGARPPLLNLKIAESGPNKTTVAVVEWKPGGAGGRGKLSKPVAGNLADITRGAMVVPIVRVQGGVYFLSSKEFGTSMVAEALLVVVGEPGGSSAAPAFDLGDAEMASEDEGEAR